MPWNLRYSPKLLERIGDAALLISGARTPAVVEPWLADS
jgi:hypothetical protein